VVEGSVPDANESGAAYSYRTVRNGLETAEVAGVAGSCLDDIRCRFREGGGLDGKPWLVPIAVILVALAGLEAAAAGCIMAAGKNCGIVKATGIGGIAVGGMLRQ
jgi:hypothetical protein